ncbi:MAG: hypothetical protein ACJA2B_000716 [Candidatus Endobugula sp.]|jgi:hypothetical protein
MKCVKCLVICCLSLLLVSCGVNIDEDLAHGVMKKIYDARKKGSFHKEFKLYDKESFKIVPFNDVAITLKAVVGGAGRFKKASHVSTKIERRNQIREGLVSYMVLTYNVEYSRFSLSESYYFLGSSEKPIIVYMTLQF